MSKTEKVSIALTPELNQMIMDAVASGQYATASEVVRDALRGWIQNRYARQNALDQTREMIQRGIDSGPGRFVSIDEVISEAKTRRKNLLKKSA